MEGLLFFSAKTSTKALEIFKPAVYNESSTAHKRIFFAPWQVYSAGKENRKTVKAAGARQRSDVGEKFHWAV